MNVYRNAVWFILLFFIVFGMGLTFYILPQISESVFNATNAVSPSSTNDRMYISFLSFKTLFLQSFYVLVSITVFLAFMSSLFSPQSWMNYIISVIVGLFCTPLAIYMTTTFWNTYSVLGITFGEISNTFISSFPTILFINLIFGLASFVMIRGRRR